jgi:hypothetical protein
LDENDWVIAGVRSHISTDDAIDTQAEARGTLQLSHATVDKGPTAETRWKICNKSHKGRVPLLSTKEFTVCRKESLARGPKDKGSVGLAIDNDSIVVFIETQIPDDELSPMPGERGSTDL